MSDKNSVENSYKQLELKNIPFTPKSTCFCNNYLGSM